MTQSGRVVASHGRHVLVEDSNGQRRICHPRGKKNQAVVGDKVQWLASEDEGSIESIEPRRNLLVAAEPEFSHSQLARALVAAEQAGIRSLIGLNKQDVVPAFDKAWARLQPYRDMAYPVLPLSLRNTADGLKGLREQLQNRTTLVLGPSGAGKSTLINRLVPQANAATNDISKALHSGKHTTTSTTWYWVDADKTTALLDSPGFQEFGLHHIPASELAKCMPDIHRFSGDCKFYNCTHVHEPQCGVRQALNEGLIDAGRYKLFTELFTELSAPKSY